MGATLYSTGENFVVSFLYCLPWYCTVML